MRKVLYIFGLLTDADIGWLAASGTRRLLDDGEVLVEQGRPAEHVMILLDGELRVTAEGYGEIARLGVGEIVGEMSFVDSEPPSATITAAGPGCALLIDRRRLLERFDADDGFAARFYRALAIFLADRLRAARPASSPARAAAALPDELDEMVMDRVAAAGERFNRMIRILGGEPPAPHRPIRIFRPRLPSG